METTFTTLTFVIELKVYYMCVREEEHFLQLQTFPSFTSASSRGFFLFFFFLAFVDVDFLPAYKSPGRTHERLDLHLRKMGIC